MEFVSLEMVEGTQRYSHWIGISSISTILLYTYTPEPTLMNRFAALHSVTPNSSKTFAVFKNEATRIPLPRLVVEDSEVRSKKFTLTSQNICGSQRAVGTIKFEATTHKYPVEFPGNPGFEPT